ncbi:MAG: xylulokinase, partial [Planctomycetota bacterium]
MPELLAGIDVGTSGVKAGVFTAEGGLLGLGRASHEVRSPHPGWAETDPADWWRGVVAALVAACGEGGLSASDVRAVGLSGVYPSVAPLDSDGNALAPSILYCDGRSLAQVEAIAKEFGREEYETLTGNRLVPGTCAATSMRWLRDERPDVYARAAVLASANTYVVAKLIGVDKGFVTDPTNSALSGVAAIADPWEWSDALSRRVGVDGARLPRIALPHEVVGTVSAAAARETGLREGTPVVPGCGDAAAATFGAGGRAGRAGGPAVYVAGSTDCLNVPAPAPPVGTGWVNCAWVERGVWMGTGTITSSGVSVEWFAREVLGGGDDAMRRMAELAASSPPGANGLLYAPYLQGERTPLWDPLARGAFVGLTSATTRADLARAVFEGPAFALRQVAARLDEVAGCHVEEMRAVGGPTRNALWNRIKADVLGRPLRVLRFQETGVLGAALMAGVGSGVFASLGEAASVTDSLEADEVAPDPAKAGVYDELFALYEEIHPRAKGIMHGLGRL